MFGLKLLRETAGRLERVINVTRALTHCTRIDGEGVAKCSGKFSEEIKVHLARLRGKFFTWKKQRSSDKVLANERTTESRIETAVGVESRAVHSSSSRDVSSHYATSSTASAMSSANSTYLSVAVPTFYLEMLYQLACSTFGSAH